MNILVTGFAFVRKHILEVVDHYPGSEKIFFLLPQKWEIKGGKYVYKPPVADNIYTARSFFSHSQYPLIGGLLKGWTPFLPCFLIARRSLEINLLYSAMEPALLSTLYEGIWAKLFGLKHVIFTWENIHYRSKFRGINLWLKELLIRLNLFFSDAIVCGNPKAAEIIANYTTKPQPVIPISGINHKFFCKVEGIRTFRSHNFENKIVYAFVGSISYRKGIHLIIEAFRNVHRQIPNAMLVIAGTGEYEKEIENHISQSGLAEAIIRLPWISHNEIQSLLSAVDVFIYPSISYKGWEEQMGYSAMEASLLELPVIASDSGNLSEIVKDGETGILVAAGNAEMLERAMIELGLNPELRRKLGQKGRQFIIDNFSHEVVAKKYERLFKIFK